MIVMELKETIYNSEQNESLSNTLFLMGNLTKLALKDRTFLKFITTYFSNLVKDPDKLFRTIYFYVRNNFVYTPDILDELLINPAKIIFLKKGDCDDFALFVFTVLKALSFDPQYLLLGKTNTGFSHIAVIINGTVIDPTNPIYNNIPEIYINRNLVQYG